MNPNQDYLVIFEDGQHEWMKIPPDWDKCPGIVHVRRPNNLRHIASSWAVYRSSTVKDERFYNPFLITDEVFDLRKLSPRIKMICTVLGVPL